MDDSLKQQLVHSIIRLRRTNLPAHNQDMDLTALIMMKLFGENSHDSDGNIYMSELQDQLCISKAAISQIANNLENKGYLTREINKNNRRKLIITLTPEGREAMRQAEIKFDEMLSAFISRIGSHDLLEVVRLFNRFADIAEELMRERN